MSSEAKETMRAKPMPKENPSVANLGIKIFYDSMVAQGTKLSNQLKLSSFLMNSYNEREEGRDYAERYKAENCRGK